MTEPKRYTLEECHKRLAVDTFNLTWELLDKTDRTEEDDERVVHAAHASRFHWGEIGTPVHAERGEWQISRVYSVLDRPQQALYHAGRCLDICQEHQIGDFDIAFAHEAMARAYAVAGDKSKCEMHIQLAKDLAVQIEENVDRDAFLSELETVPGYE